MCIVLAAGARSVTAQSVEDSPSLPHPASAELAAFLEPLIRHQLESRKIAGAVVVVVKDGQVLFKREIGRADVATGRAMGPQTLMRIGSATKTITALAVMQLVETGGLDLDRDINHYLDFAVPAMNDGAAVTLRRLMSHRTGFEDRRGQIATVHGHRLPLGPFLAQHMPPTLRQGADVVAYSNYNAALAAYIVERASGQSFEQYVEEHIFRPLEMRHTTAVQPLPATLQPHVSNGYIRADLPPTIVSSAVATIQEVGSTGVSTTAEDMGRLLLSLLERDPRIISRASLETMMSPQASVSHGFVALGMYSPVGAGRNAFIGHDGGTGSFHSVLALLPQARFGLFASYNSDGVPATVPASAELVQEVAERYFRNVELPPSGNSARLFGTYQSTRRVESNFFSLRALFEQISVRGTGDNQILLRSAAIPVGGFTLVERKPGRFEGAAIDATFGGSGASVFMQLGAPVLLYNRVPWFASARLWVPVLAISLLAGAVILVTWPLSELRHRIRPSRRGVRTRALTRLALLLYIAAITASIWLVLWRWDLAAFSSPIVPPLAIGIYAAAWSAVGLTPFAVWNGYHRVPGRGAWATWRERMLAALLVMLAFFCLYWRVAGTTLAF